MAEYIDKWYGDGVKDERNKWITKIEKRIEELKSFPAYKKGFDKNLFGYDDIISELKSLVESDGIPQTSKIPIKEQNESAIDVSKGNKDGVQDPVLVEKYSSENSKDNKSIITIHSVEVVTPELIAKSMFPKKKDDKK